MPVSYFQYIHRDSETAIVPSRPTLTPKCDGGSDAMDRETWRAYDKARRHRLASP